jgi:hypothetical protein
MASAISLSSITIFVRMISFLCVRFYGNIHINDA